MKRRCSILFEEGIGMSQELRSKTIAALLIFAMPAFTTAESSTLDEWITGAASDQERFKRLERYLRGFDQPMWEVGERYEKIHAALARGNFELAAYHWRKIKTTIENGVLKRPAREANAQAFLLKDVWSQVLSAFESENTEAAWQGFVQARSACMGCHVAEQVAFVNDQPMFELAGPR